MDYAAADTWPEHPDAYWRVTLDHARRRGWSLRRFSGHAWGEIRCPSGACRKKVYTSGKSNENVARGVRRLVDRCPHQVGFREVLDEIEERLVKAERLVDAAKALAGKGRVTEQLELLENCVELLDEDDSFWAQVEILYEEESRYDEAAAEAFADAGEAAPGPNEALDLAEVRVRGIRKDLKSESPRVKRVKELKARADALRNRIRTMRAAL